MKETAAVKIFLADGDRASVRTAEISNWTGKAVAGPRSQLLSEGVLTEQRDRLVFAKDYEFTSPSAAASVVHGGHANGLVSWKNSKGVTLKELEQKDMANNH